MLGLIRADSLSTRGHLFVLIGRRTSSAAQFLVSELEHWTDAIFVGEALERGGPAAMDSAYRAYGADPRHRYASTEAPLNALGYALLQEHRPADAVAVFTLNTEAFPGSANAHDSRGEALATAGDTAAAIRDYEAAVRLDPALPGAADKLRALRGEWASGEPRTSRPRASPSSP